MFTPWWYGAYWPSASNYAILSPVRTGRNDYKLNFSCTLVKRFTLNAQCAILNLSLFFFVIPVDKISLQLLKPVVSWCIWQKNLTGSKLRGRCQCFQIKVRMSSKVKCFLQYFLPLIEFLNIQSQYLNVNLKTLSKQAQNCNISYFLTACSQWPQ